MRYFLTCLLSLFLLLSAVSVEAAQVSVLAQSDVKIIKNILKLHRSGQYTKAKQEASRLRNHTLDGYILYDKYLSAKYKTSKAEIETWLRKYQNLPVAPEIYALGKRKKMTLKASQPRNVLYGGKSKACSYVRRDEPIDLIRKRKFSYLSPDRQKKATQSFTQLYNHIRKGQTKAARQLIESADFQQIHTTQDIALAQTALAFSYFLDGEYKYALKHAKIAISKAASTPLAYWTAGLASWRLEKYSNAADYFAQTASHSQIYPLLRGSAAFWAARGYLKTGDYAKVGDYLEVAAQQPQTFYGMLALRMLGQELNPIWNAVPDKLCQTDKFSNPALTRFYALKQIDKKEWATKELTQLYLKSNNDDRRTLSAISKQNGFKKELMYLSGTTTGNSDERFPAPDWTPQTGWKVDKALIYAFVRQESCFNPVAKSAIGARGLMQIMPTTGKAMAQAAGLRWSLTMMDNISYNLALGQKYVQYLLGLPAVNNNLIYLSVAYNGGPGNLIKWKKQTQYTNDPLLFIESIPSRETRSFVERIMVNYWTYQGLMGKKQSTIDEVIAGKWPIYRKN